MSSTVSLTTLSELSDELNKRISELELLSYQSERILLLLNLCELENDPECEQNNDEFQINVQPEELALDRDNNSPKFAGRVESAVSPTTTSLEDVLSMARAIRSKGAGQIIVPQSIVNEKSNTALERKQVSKARTPSAPLSGRSVAETKKLIVSLRPPVIKEKLPKRNKSDTNQRVINDHFQGIISSSNIDDSVIERGVRIREHLFAQLDILKRNKRVLTQNISYGIDKELYCAQERLLTKLNCRKTFPRSVAYSALQLEKKKSKSHQIDPAPLTPREKFLAGPEYFQDEEKNVENSIEILISALEEDKEHYDKILKGKLNRIPISKIGKEDLKDIFKTWYKTQKNLELYESFQNERKDHEIDNDTEYDYDTSTSRNLCPKKDVKINDETNEINELRSLKLQTLDLLSCNLEKIYSVSATTDEIISSREWLQNTQQENKYFHDELDLRIRYLVEVSMGRIELKTAIRQLKVCCGIEKEGKNTHHHDQDLENNHRKWIFALKYYKAVHTCLAVSAQNTSSCMFIQNNIQ